MNVEALLMGRVLVDLYPNEWNVPLKDVQTFAKFLGGTAGNTAVGLARLGASVGMISKVGDDGFGVYLKEVLEREGIDHRFVTVDRTYRTALAFCEVYPPDHFPITFYRTPSCPDLQLRIEDIPLEVLRGMPLLHATGTALCQSPSREATFYALEQHRGDGRINVFDIDYRPMVWDHPYNAHTYADFALSLADIVIGNLDEVEMATGRREPAKAARRILDAGARVAVVKMGGQGCEIFTADAHLTIPPYRVDVVNGLGAGDAFNAAFEYGLLRGLPLPQCGRMGNAAGALVATQLGCSVAMPTLERLELFMAEQEMLTGDQEDLSSLDGQEVLP